MRRNLLWILFAVSLALNLGLAAGALHFVAEAERLGASAAARVETIAERLELTEAQRDGLLALRAGIRERREAMGSFRDQRRTLLLAELAKPELDQVRLAEVMDGGMGQRRAFFEGLVVELHGYLATLTPEQKESFLAMAGERHFLRALFGFGAPPERAAPGSQTRAQN